MSFLRPHRTVAVLVVAVLLGVVPAASGIAPAAAAPEATDPQTPPAGHADGPSPATDSNRTTEHRGDVVAVSLSTAGAANASVSVAAADGGYEANLSLVDADGDGTVVLRWNTYRAGHGGGYEAVGDDTATILEETTVEGRLPAGRYTVAATADGERVDGDIVELVPSPAPAIRSLATVPTQNVSLEGPGDVRSAVRGDSLRPSERVMLREVLVLALEAPGVGGAFAAQEGPNESARFASLVSRTGFHFSLRQDDATVNLHELPGRFRLEGPGVRLLPDGRNDTYYLVLDVDAASLEPIGGTGRRSVEDGDWFGANLTVGPASGIVDSGRTATLEDVAVEEAAVVLDYRTEPYVAAAPNQRLSARTNLPTGVPVTVTVTTAASDYERRLTVPVTAGPGSNRVNATLNLTSVPYGATLFVRYELQGRPLHNGDQFAHVESDDLNVTVVDLERPGDQSSSVAVTADVTLPGEGFVVLHANSSRGRVLGSTRLEIGGTHEGVTVTTSASLADVERVVVVLHEAWGGGPRFDGDPALVANGTRVAAAVPVPPEETPTADGAAQTDTPVTPTTGTTPDDGPEATGGTNDRTSTATGTTVPGFGVAGALVAVVTAALARRR